MNSVCVGGGTRAARDSSPGVRWTIPVSNFYFIILFSFFPALRLSRLARCRLPARCGAHWAWCRARTGGTWIRSANDAFSVPEIPDFFFRLACFFLMVRGLKSLHSNSDPQPLNPLPFATTKLGRITHLFRGSLQPERRGDSRALALPRSSLTLRTHFLRALAHLKVHVPCHGR